MYHHQRIFALIPAVLSTLTCIVNGVPTPSDADVTPAMVGPEDRAQSLSDLIKRDTLSKRDTTPWVAFFSDIGCHNKVSQEHNYLNVEGCLAWNSSWTEHGLNIGVNWGSGDFQTYELSLFTDQGCTTTGNPPLFPGTKEKPPGNYVTRAPRGMYSGAWPEGICFDGVHRSWPKASDGSSFQSLKADNY